MIILRIKYNEKTKDYTLFNYIKRNIGKDNDIIVKQEKLNRKFDFEPDDLAPTIYAAETMNIFKLVKEEKDSTVETYVVDKKSKINAEKEKKVVKKEEKKDTNTFHLLGFCLWCIKILKSVNVSFNPSSFMINVSKWCSHSL